MCCPKIVAQPTRSVAKLIKEVLSEYIYGLPKGERAIVLGAGQCNDIPVELLKERYAEVILIEKHSSHIKYLKENIEVENVKLIQRDISPISEQVLRDIEKSSRDICDECGITAQNNQVGRVISEYLIEHKSRMGRAEDIYENKADLVIASMVLHHVARDSAKQVVGSIKSQICGMNSFVDGHAPEIALNIFKKLTKNVVDLLKENGRCLMVFPSFRDFKEELYKHIPWIMYNKFKEQGHMYKDTLDFYLLSKLFF